MKRHAAACQVAAEGSVDYHLSVDAKRFGGKHWLAGVVCTGRTLQCSVTNPIVSPTSCNQRSEVLMRVSLARADQPRGGFFAFVFQNTARDA